MPVNIALFSKSSPARKSSRLFSASLLSVSLAAVSLSTALFGASGYGQEQDAATGKLQTHVYFADAVWTGLPNDAKDGLLRNAAIVIQNGKVLKVTRRQGLETPAGWQTHELGPVTIIPGLVVAETTLVESNRDDDYALNPEVRSVDGFDAFADYEKLLAGGITTVQLSPGSQRLLPGQGAVVKLAGEDALKQILVESESVRVVLTSDALSPPTIYEPPVGAVSVDRPVEPTRPQLATSLAQAIVGLRALLSEANEIVGGKENEDRVLQALAELRSADRCFRFAAGSDTEVQAALELAKEFQLRWILADPQELDALLKLTDWQSPKVQGVLLNPELRPGRFSNPSVPRSDRRKPLPVWERAKQLVASGAADKLAFKCENDADLDKLLYLATLLGRGGLNADQILRTLTVNPARILGVDDRVGSLKPGADADFVVLSGHPLAGGSKVLATYVDGHKVFSAARSQSGSVIRAGAVYGPEGVLSDASISVVDGKIRSVGTSVSAPAGAVVKDFGKAIIVPGFIDLSTTLGITGSLGDSLSLDTKIGDFLERDDRQIGFARQGGTTTAFYSNSRLPSPVVAFKLTDLPHVLKDPVAIRFEIKGNLTAAEASVKRTLATGKAYADAWKKYDGEFADYQKKLAEYEVEKSKYDAAVKAEEAEKAEAEKKADEAKKAEDAKKAEVSKKEADPKPSEKPDADGDKKAEKSEGKDADKPDAEKPSAEKPDSKNQPADGKDPADKPVEPKKPTEPQKPRASAALEPYRDLFAGKIPAIVELSDTKAVAVAIKLFREEFDVKTAIAGGQAVADDAAKMAEKQVMVIAGPTLVGEENGQLKNFAAQAAIASAMLGFQSGAGTGVREFPTAVSYAVFEGLGGDDALAALTSTPAKFFGLESVGQISAGHDADLVVLSGPPLELSSEVLAVMIDGKWVYEKESE